MNKSLYFAACVLLTAICISCGNTKKAVYFYNVKDTTLQAQIQLFENIIQKNDILGVSITSLNSEASSIFNTANTFSISSVTASENNAQTSGYLVNPDGYIQMPFLGNIKASGLTKSQLRESITRSIIQNKLLLDPIVVIRHLNFRVTVLGEVAHPTVITVPSEKISLMEAIGLAGDLTIYAKRDNVLLIREENGNKKIMRINLNKSDILTSSLYNLQPNDVVYVEPNKARVAGSSQTRQLLPIILSALSVTAVIISRLTL